MLPESYKSFEHIRKEYCNDLFHNRKLTDTGALFFEFGKREDRKLV